MEKLRSRFAYILVMLASRARDRKRPNREISLLRTRDVFLVRAMRDETASCKTLSSSNLLPLLLRDRESFFISSDEYFSFFSVCGYDRRSLFLLEILSESIYRRVMIFKTNERIIGSAILILNFVRGDANFFSFGFYRWMFSLFDDFMDNRLLLSFPLSKF